MPKKVESFRLTKDFKSWRGEFKKVRGIRNIIAKKLQANIEQTQQLQEMFQMAEGKQKELFKLAPVDNVSELSMQSDEI